MAFTSHEIEFFFIGTHHVYSSGFQLQIMDAEAVFYDKNSIIKWMESWLDILSVHIAQCT